jgi:DNA ligase (NAD+)
MNRIDKLAAQIMSASAAYYNATPVMSDADFDALESELRKLDPNNPVFAKIGAPVASGWPKAQHPHPVGSLEKAQTPAEFRSWAAGKPDSLFLSEKLDGISILLTYSGGELVSAVTRGDGVEGEDITRNVRIMQGVPATLSNKHNVFVRGEIVCLREDFQKFFQGESNPRNTASGTSKRQSGWQKCRHLTVVAYNLSFGAYSGPNYATRDSEFAVLQSWGFKTPFGKSVTSREAVQVYGDYIKELRDKAPYDIDGLVIEVNSTEERIELGTTPNGLNPKGAVALKFPHDQKKTILRDVVWQVGNSGRVTPVAIFDEVDLAGARVKQASLHNVARLNKLQLFKGCEILVSRRNDVIPFVEENVSLGITFNS